MRHEATGSSRKVQFFGFVLSTLLFAFCFSANAEQQANLPKIGWLGVRPASSPGGNPGGLYEAIQGALRELGYIEGKNVRFEYRSAGNNLELLPALADELVRLKVDVLLTPATVEALAAKKATRTIPIVFYSVGDPVGVGLVDTLARPGGNITGFAIIGPLLSGKRLELLKETIPKLSRVAVLWNPQNSSSAQEWKESQQPARELGLQLHSVEVRNANEFDSAFKEAIKARSGGLAVLSSAFITTHQKLIANLAVKHRLPAIFSREDYVENGGLMSYGADQTEAYRRAASIVDKILKGTKPAEIPVEQPTKFELVINLKTAKQIGLTIPPNMLARADKVIK